MQIRHVYPTNPMLSPFFRRLAVLVLITGIAAASLSAQTAANYATVRSRLSDSQTGGTTLNPADSTYSGKISALNSSAQTQWNNLIKTANRTQLWSDLPISSTDSDSLTAPYLRLNSLAIAYATPGAGLYRNTALRDDILSALEWLNANHYNPSRPFYGNWFPWHLAIPLNVVGTFACLHDGITDTARRSALYSAYASAIDYYQNTAGRTYAWSGANLVWRAKIDLGLGAALESSTRLALGRDRLSALAGVGNERNVFAYVTTGDGFYSDGSFIQHNTHAYTGGYGLYLLNELSTVVEIIAATPWSITDPNLANLFKWADDAFDPVMFRGGIMAHTQGREISRSGSAEHPYGHAVLTSIARLARFAPTADAARFRALVKQQVTTDAYRNFLGSANLASAALVKPILDDSAVVARSPRTGLFVLAGMDRVVLQRGSWAYAVSLSSKRISKYECINGENLRGWYLGDGAAYIYNGDLAQYSDAYWPTVNPYRLAGTTVDNRARANAGTSSPNTIDPRTTKAWVGGSSVVGDYGAAGMDHEAAQSDLRGKLSWFFFDDEVVHLGAGLITSAANTNRVESVVMARMIGHAGNNGGAAFTANGTARAATSGVTESLTGVTYAHLDAPFQTAYGTGSIGYYFPSPAALQARREARTGAWSDINSGGSTTAVTRNFLNLWFDHGTGLLAPGASFAYAVLPGKTAAQTATYQQNPDIQILSNSVSVQAVREQTLNALAANFWSASPAATDTVAGLTADRPCSVSLLTRNGQLNLGVSDPTQELTAASPLILELPAGATATVSKDSAITVLALAPRVRLSINLAGTGGRSLAATFSVAPLTAAPDSAATSPGTPVRIDVLANDSSASGGALSVTSATFTPPSVFAPLPHGVAVLDAASTASFPSGLTNASGAASPAALSALPGFSALTAWRDATRAFAPKGSSATGITNYQLRSDAAKSALRFQINANTTSNPSAGGATTSIDLTGSTGDALYVGAVGSAFTGVAVTVGAYSTAAQDAATLGYRTTEAASGRPLAVRALGFVVAGIGSGRTFTAEFRGVRGQLLASQSITASSAGTKAFFGLDSGTVTQEWIHTVVLRGDNGSANIGLDDVGYTPVTAVNTGSLAFVDGLPVYTAPASFSGVSRFAYTVSDGVNTAEAEVTINISTAPVAISSATASTFQDPNTPGKVLDGITDASVSRWSGFGDGATLTLTLASRQKIGAINISTFEGNLRRALFDVQTSDDGLNWTTVFSGSSSGTTTDLERIALTPSWGLYLRIVGHGYIRNDAQPGALWNSFGEVQVIPSANTAPLASPISANLRPGVPFALNLLASAADPDNGPAPLTLSTTTPANGTLQLSGGVATYTPPAGFRGLVSFNYTVSDGGLSSTALVSFNVGAPATATAFTALYFDGNQREDPAISGDDADPDADGLCNLLEYAFARDPLAADAASAYTLQTSGLGPQPPYLQLAFTRNLFATDLTYTVEAGSNLSSWTPIARAIGQDSWVNLGGGAQSISETPLDAVTSRATITDGSTVGSARFLRLRVSR